MASLTYSIGTFSNGTIQVNNPSPLFWVPHDKCRISYDLDKWQYNSAQTGKPRATTINNNKPMPEVYRLDPEQNFPIPDRYKQLLIDINPQLPPEKALGLMATGLAFCNKQYAVFDQARFMGGATVTGRKDGNILWLKTLNVNDPPPKAADVLADQTLWFWCVSVTPKNTINYWRRLGKDGTMQKCRMFLIADKPVYVNLDELKPVSSIVEDATIML